MKKTNVIELNLQAKSFDDPLEGVIRSGAWEILKEALEANIEMFLEQFK